MKNKRFIDFFIEGKLDADDVDDFVGLWHEGDLKLCEFLGLSWDEYGRLALDPDALEEIKKERIAQSEKGCES